MAHERLKPEFQFDEEKIKQLKQIAPECFEDGKINFETLRQNLGNWSQEEDEGDLEHFGLFWPGKKEARKAASLAPEGTLEPIYGEGLKADGTPDDDGVNDSKNIFIEGENLEVLKILQKSYANKIKMIYIDPPYNTGNDFVYDDDFTEPLQEYLRRTGQIDEEGKPMTTNKKSDGRFHSRWLSMMYPRLRLARNLLKEDGVIFVSIDDNEVHNLRSLMNEIYGEENYLGTITVINNMKGRNNKANIATCHEYVMIYSNGEFESLGIPLSEEQLSKYKFKDEDGNKFALRDLRKRGGPDRREDRPNMFIPIFYNEKSKQCSLERNSEEDVEIVPLKGDKAEGRWRWGIDSVKNNLDILHPKYSQKKDRWDIQYRVYLSQSVRSNRVDDEESDDEDQNFDRSSIPKSFWWGGEISTDVATREFKKLIPHYSPDYPKSPFFIDKLLHMAVRDGDIVLDFFAGTGSTVQSVLNFAENENRKLKYILVQIPEKIEENSEAFTAGYKTLTDITVDRIKQVSKNKDKINDIGFKYMKLSTSNFRKWKNFESGEVSILEDKLELFAQGVFEDKWSKNKLLSEIILLEGHPLHSAIGDRDLGKNIIKTVSSDTMEQSLHICLDAKLEESLIKELELDSNQTFVCLDSAISNQDKLRLSDKGLIKTI
ncbi:MAG: site-specific DNA-methyltransferase [Crocinitomicaceae bacterium]|nr:site-specific DNA-methyltransferase [Flavobacteriales bacterium]NQZ36926.1 site-specific DNA-methyltransferase [Crocinitomicaceae bacterium]